MNILILNWRDITHPQAGGAEIHLHELAKRWVNLGHKVSMLVPAYLGSKREDVIDDVQVVRRGGTYSIYVEAFKYIMGNARKFDVIFESINTIPFLTPLYSPIPTVAQIYSIQNKKLLLYEFSPITFPAMFGPYLLSSSIPLIYRLCEIVTISDYSKIELIRHGFNPSRVHVAYPGIPDNFIKLVNEVDGFVERPNHIIIYVGRLKKYKGVQDILRALPHVRKKIPDVKFWIVGKGDYKKELEKLVKTLNIEDLVVFWGFVSERRKAELLKSSSLFVCTSIDEGGWTISALEAQLCGVPVLLSPSQSNALIHGKTGYLVRDVNPRTLAEQIMKVLNNYELWKILSTNASNWAKDFTWDKTASITLKALRASISRE
jgi:glycosyltransferase involved in cell wall biosynthesis